MSTTCITSHGTLLWYSKVQWMTTVFSCSIYNINLKFYPLVCIYTTLFDLELWRHAWLGLLQTLFTWCHRRRSPTGCKGDERGRASSQWVTLAYKYRLKTVLHDELHWLNVRERIEYKLGVMVYRCLHDRAPRWSPHPSLWCCSSPSSSMIRNVRLSGSLSRCPNCLELVARWT